MRLPSYLVALAPTLAPTLALLAGCAQTPRQHCEWPLKRELGVVWTEMRETEDRIRRGYKLVAVESGYGPYCKSRAGIVSLCFDDDEGPFYDKAPINRSAERAKLAALQAEAARLQRALAACRPRSGDAP